MDENNNPICLIPQTLIQISRFSQLLMDSKPQFQKISTAQPIFELFEADLTLEKIEKNRQIINDFLKELNTVLNSLRIEEMQFTQYQNFFESISWIHSYVYLKKVFLHENIPINSQFYFTIILIFFLKLFRGKSKKEKNKVFFEKDFQEKFLDTMYIFSKNYLDLCKTGKKINFFKVDTNYFANRHSNKEFFESISTKLSDETQEKFLVLENLGLIVFYNVLKLMEFHEEIKQEKLKTQIFLDNFLGSCLKVCSNLIEWTYQTQEISINLIQSLTKYILKIFVYTLKLKRIGDILYEKLKNDGFKEIKFLVKVVFIILFEDVHFEDFEISNQNFENFQPDERPIKTLIKVVHLNSESEKISIFQAIMQVNKYLKIFNSYLTNFCFKK